MDLIQLKTLLDKAVTYNGLMNIDERFERTPETESLRRLLTSEATTHNIEELQKLMEKIK